jgi:hypothetical protein
MKRKINLKVECVLEKAVKANREIEFYICLTVHH